MNRHIERRQMIHAMPAVFRKLDLKTKIVAACVVMFVAAIWLLAHDAAEEVRDDFKAVIAAEQTALVEHITDSLEEESKLRINTLKDVASLISPEMMGDHVLLGGVAPYRPVGGQLVPMEGDGLFPVINGGAGID